MPCGGDMTNMGQIWLKGTGKLIREAEEMVGGHLCENLNLHVISC